MVNIFKTMNQMDINEAIKLYESGILSEDSEAVLLRRLVDERK